MKKQYMNYMKSCLLVMIACLVSMVGAAQGFSPAAMEQLKTRRLWSHSQNAAGMPFDDIQNYSNVILGYTYDSLFLPLLRTAIVSVL